MRRFIYFVLYAIAASPSYAQNVIDSLKARLEVEKVDTAKVALMFKIGDEYRDSKRDSSLWYYQQALNVSKKTGHAKAELVANIQIAELLVRGGNYPEALRLSMQTLDASEQAHDTDNIFWSKRTMMWAYDHLGDRQKEFELAKELVSLAHSAYFQTSGMSNRYLLVAYNNLGTVYADLNQLDSAIKYLDITYKISLKNQAPQGIAVISQSLEQIYSQMKNYDSALHLCRAGIPYALKAHRLDLVRDFNFAIAGIFEKKALFDSALIYGRQSFFEYKRVADTAGMTNAASLLAKLFRHINENDSAYQYLELSVALNESQQNENKIKKAQDIIFNDTLRRGQMEQEKKEAEEKYKARIKIYSLIIGLAVMLLIALILYRNNKQKQKAKNEIEKAYDELKTAQALLIQSEKMASLGELTAGIAHEIQNPLNFVNNFSEVSSELVDEWKAELAKGNGPDAALIADDIKQNLEKVIHHGRRADAIVKSMLEHSRTSSGQMELTDINALADEYLRLAYHGMRARDKSFNAKLETDFDPTIGKIKAVPQDIGRVILNLINNAFYAVTEKSKLLAVSYEPLVVVSTRKIDSKVEVKVRDNGNGIPRFLVDKIFQPFFTTKPAGQGTGLGLSLSYDIVKTHGGDIKVETREGEGTEFIIEIPITQ
jgi:signal transduction histidine kinase